MRLACLYLAALITIAGCSADPGRFRTDSGGTTDGPTSNVCSSAGQVVCVGNSTATCDSTLHPTNPQACDQSCTPGLGCTVCRPGARSCDGSGTPQVCNDTGTGNTAGVACSAGQTCSAGMCSSPADLCAASVMSHSYIGCDYWFTSTLNSQLGSFPTNDLDPSSAVGVAGFPFAVAVANPQGSPATVTISGGGVSGMTTTIAAGALGIVQLPWIQSVSQVTQANTMAAEGHSVLAHNAAYHLSSDVPVTIYDFNALSYQDTRPGHAHCDPTTDLTCFSFTNDASLLLPTSVLTGNYTVLGWPSEATQYMGSVEPSFGGFAAIIGTSATPTHVTIALTGGVAGSSGVPTAAAGGTITQTLNQGDVLEVVSGSVTHCTPSSHAIQTDQLGNPVYACATDGQHDLTGSIITADQPVAVYGGHDCANVPYDRAACDHLEEELFPNETLGQHYLVSYTQPQQAVREPNWIRIMSNHAGNAITFNPASAHAPVTLDRGAFVDFLQTTDFEVTGTAAFAVAQFTVGENYTDASASDPSAVGDPAMVLEVPVEQWRTSYEFLAPDTYTKSYVNVVAQHGASITLDGAPLGASPVVVNAFDVYRLDISSRTGAHHIESAGTETFAIKVYGFGSYTAYMYPGGLDLTVIAPPG